MNYRIFTLILSILFLNIASFAHLGSAQDVVDPVDFSKAKFSLLTVSGKKWIKATLQLRCKGDLEAKATGADPDWLKDVDISLICAYENKKKEMVWFSSEANLFALERSSEYYLNFYIPAEIVSMYSLKAEPVGYMIELTANGKEYPLNAKNYTKRSNLTASNVKSFMDTASAKATSAVGTMLYYDEAPFAVKIGDKVDSKQVAPTSKPKK